MKLGDLRGGAAAVQGLQVSRTREEPYRRLRPPEGVGAGAAQLPYTLVTVLAAN